MGYGINGTPWHVEIIGPTDEKRNKSRCIYFSHIKGRDGHCSIKCCRCTGSSHCDQYRESSLGGQVTCANVPPKIEKTRDFHDIRKIKLGYNIEDVDYDGKDGEHLDEKTFYQKLREGAMPKTSQINPFTAREHIEPFLKDGYDVLYVSFSSGLSGSCNSVKIAALELNDDYKERKELYTSLRAKLSKDWSLELYNRQDLSDRDVSLEHGGKLIYEDECFKLIFNTHKYNSTDPDYDDGYEFSATFLLKTLGGIGSE